MSKRKLIVIWLLFVLYLALVWISARFLVAGDNYVLVSVMLSLLGLTVLIVYLLVSRLTRRLGAAQAPPPSSPAPGEQPAPASQPARASGPDPEIDAVTALIAEANARLAQSPTLAARRIRTQVGGLPTYLLLGAEGAGKTTTFLGAGLEPELLAGQVYRDSTVLPTKLCNFWYAGESIFIEPSGSIFNQDPGRWLRLLKHLRPRGGSLFAKLTGKTKSNFRGAILCVDINPFLGIPDNARLGGIARKLQERLRLIGEVFGSHFPVYVLFTKSDAIPYFTDYFGRMAENEDQQILGCTLPLSLQAARPAGEVFAESESSRLAEAFNQIYYSLAEKRTLFLAREPVAARRVPIYEFPRELKRIRDTLVQFLVDVFRPNPLQPSPLLRGFYFTGTRQVAASAASPGLVRDVVRGPATGEATSLFNLADYQKKVGLTAPEPSGAEPTVTRWSFVSELFHRVILGDRLDAVAGFRHRKLDLYRRIVFGAAAALGLLLCLLFLRSWYGNRELLHAVKQAELAPYSFQPGPMASPSLDDLRSIDGLRAQLETLLDYDRNGPPWRLRWFLYSGSSVLPALHHLYFQRFRQMLFDDVHAKLVAGLQRLPTSSDGSVPYGTAYDTLKAYRMVTSCKCKPDKAFLAPLMLNQWNLGRNLDQERLGLAFKQFDFYAGELAHENPYNVQENDGLVSRARQYLSTFHGVDQIYRGLLQVASQTAQPARIADLAPNFRQTITGPGQVDAAFTAEGWQAFQKALQEGGKQPIGEVCVLGPGAALSSLMPGSADTAALENLYLKDFIAKWEDFTRQTGVQGFSNAADAAQKLAQLAGNRSPLLAAIYLISRNTNLPVPAAAAQSGLATAERASSSGLLSALGLNKAQQTATKAKTISAAAKATEGPGAPAPPALTPADVVRIFQPARQVVPPSSADRLISTPNQNYMSALANMAQAMDNLKGQRPNNPDMNLNQAAKQAADAGMNAVRQLAQNFNINGSDGMDTEIQRILESPFRDAMRFVVTDAGKVGRDKAGAAAKTFCAALAKLQRKFPFDPTSATDTSLDEFAAVFAPQNSAYSLLIQSLGKSVAKQGRLWISPPDADPLLTQEYLQFLNRVAAISDAFFPADSNGQPRLHYSLKIEPNPNTQGITLNADGETASATKTASQAKQFSWPGNGQQEAHLRVNVGASVPYGDYTGTWAIFRLLANADPRPPGSRTAVLSKVRGQGASQPSQVTDSNNNPIVVRIDITDPPNGIDVFAPGFFALRCPAKVAQ
jgi:type VI secretion system protein ImpL